MLRRDPQGQRQARAQLRELGQVGRGIPAAAGSGDLPHQGDRVGFLEDVQPDALRAVADRQPGQLVPARDDDERAGAAGDEGAHLADVRHVVEHDQHAAIGDKRPEQRGPAVEVAGIDAGSTPRSRRNLSSTTSAVTAGPSSKPRRLAYSSPSGNWSRTRCAQCSARAVFPDPGGAGDHDHRRRRPVRSAVRGRARFGQP